jgi:methylated-DNA-protein-cysteine methyltransferase-like protein
MKCDTQQFAQDVYAIVKLIPAGRVTSYGAIAKALAQARQARLVGYALNRCPESIPAHRVVNRNGVLTGREFFGGDRMAVLLREEGVEVRDNKIVDFEKVFWNPLIEL